MSKEFWDQVLRKTHSGLSQIDSRAKGIQQKLTGQEAGPCRMGSVSPPDWRRCCAMSSPAALLPGTRHPGALTGCQCFRCCGSGGCEQHRGAGGGRSHRGCTADVQQTKPEGRGGAAGSVETPHGGFTLQTRCCFLLRDGDKINCKETWKCLVGIHPCSLPSHPLQGEQSWGAELGPGVSDAKYPS